MYNKKKLFEETHLLNRADSQGGSQGTRSTGRIRGSGICCCHSFLQSKEITTDQLTDFFFSLFLHGLPERLLLYLKNKMKQPPKNQTKQKENPKNPHQTIKPTTKPSQTYISMQWQQIHSRALRRAMQVLANLPSSLLATQWCVQCECWVLGSVRRPKIADPTGRFFWVSQHWGQRLKWELPLVTAMVFPSLVLRSCTESFNVTA